MPETNNTFDLLQAALSCAVPLWVEKLKRQSWEELNASRERCMNIVAHQGDNILYRSKKPGATAEAFNAMAEAIAILSFAPGGIKVFGLQFQNHHPEVSYAEQAPAQES